MRPSTLAVPAVLTALLITLAPPALHAAPYAVDIVVDSEEEINLLYQEGDISSEERDTLLTMYLTRLDLNLAARDELYDLPGFTYTLADAVIKAREDRERFYKMKDLMEVEGMTEEIFRQIVTFATVTDASDDERAYEAQIRAGAVARVGVPNNNEDEPSSYLRSKVRFLSHGGAGFLFAVRPMNGEVGDARYGIQCKTSSCLYGESLHAEPEALRFDPAGFHVYWDGPRLSGIGGSFRVGYGLGLTMDNSDRRLPHGWYDNLDFSEDTESGKVRPFEGFVGLALRHKQIDLGRGWLDISVFGSAWNRDFYIHDTYYNRLEQQAPGWKCKPNKPKNRNDPPGTCDCPTDKMWRNPSNNDEDNGECINRQKVPSLVATDAAYYPASGITGWPSLNYDYPTLQGIMRELIGGANATYWINRRSRVGITGYVGNWHMNAEAKDFSPALSSKYPFGRSTWGVVGAHTRFGWGRYDFAAEVAVTDQGDVGALAQGWLRPLAHFELIPSVRYYGPGFDNPYNRGLANGDEFQGNRARDELGGRLQLKYRPFSLLRISVELDIWYHEYPGIRLDRDETDPNSPSFISDDGVISVPPDPATDLEAKLRFDVKLTSKERFAVWALFHDEALDRTGHDKSYAYISATTASEMEDDGNPSTNLDLVQRPVGWGGQKVSYAITAVTERIPKVTVTALFKHIFEDTKNMADAFDQSYYFWIRISAKLKPGPYIAARFKYFEEYATSDEKWYPSQSCGNLANESYSNIQVLAGGDPLPASCRGETYIDAYLTVSQKLPVTMFKGSLLSLRAGWTRWTDNRRKWEVGYGGNPDPSRDEVSVKGHMLVKF